jgi:hypothetical protein
MSTEAIQRLTANAAILAAVLARGTGSADWHSKPQLQTKLEMPVWH